MMRSIRQGDWSDRIQRLNRSAMATAFLAIWSGCATQSSYWPQQPNPSNPWTNSGPSLPPPIGVTPGAPAGGGNPSGLSPAPLPSVPALPPPRDNFSPAPGAYGSPPSGSYGAGTTGPSTLTNPGTMREQQQRATRFDPYADNDAAPAIVGGRPRDFQKPLAEPVRARGFRDTRWPF